MDCTVCDTTELFLNFYFYLFFIEVQLIYNVVLVSGIQQSDSVISIHTYVYIFLFQILSFIGYYKILYIVPYAIQ